MRFSLNCQGGGYLSRAAVNGAVTVHISQRWVSHNYCKPKEPKEKRDSYQCGSCGVEFVKWADLKNHYRTVHVHKDLSGQCQYHCVACNTMFDTLSKLKYHAKNAHLNKKAHKCKYCDETFTRPLYLNKHVKTVHEDKYLKCDECGKSCNSEASK